MATRYWVTGGTGNYDSTTNWSASSGGASGASVPTSADDAIWDANSGAGTVVINVPSDAKSIDFTNFTGTVDFQNTLAVFGNMTLGAGMSFSNTTGTPLLRIRAAATLTSNGVAFPYDFSVLASSVIITLADDWECNNFTHDVGSTNPTFNGNNFFINGSLSNLTTNRYILGTTVFVMQGTGSISSLYASSDLYYTVNNLTINTAGTITFATNLGGINGVWTYTAGTVITTGMTLTLRGTFDLDGITFENLYIYSSTTLLSDLTCTDTISTRNITSGVNVNGATIRHTGATGGITNLVGTAGGSTRLQGTTVLSFEGSGSINTGGTQGSIGLPITINTSGTYTPSSIFSINGSTFTYTSGTIDFSSVRLDIRQNNQTTTFNGISSFTFNELLMGSINHDIFIVLNDTMNVNTIIAQSSTGSGTIINRFSGTHAFVCDEFQVKGGRRQVIELQDGLTYIINNKLWSPYTSLVAPYAKIQSTSSGSKANINLLFGADQELFYVQFEDIDASSGQTLWTFGSLPIITNCDNINKFTKPNPVGN
jgi:hypothetical protein